MATRTLKNYSGQIIGYIDTDNRGSQTLKNFSGTILGYYKPDRDITQNYSGTIMGYGNTLTMLLNDASIKSESVGRPIDNKKQDPRKVVAKVPYNGRSRSTLETALWIFPPAGALCSVFLDVRYFWQKTFPRSECTPTQEQRQQAMAEAQNHNENPIVYSPMVISMGFFLLMVALLVFMYAKKII